MPISTARTLGLMGSRTTAPSAPVEVAEQRGASGSEAGDADNIVTTEAPAEDADTTTLSEPSARNISGATTETDEPVYDLPRRDDGIPDEFAKLRDEAERLQQEIVGIEAEIAEGAKEAETRLASREIEQILLCWQMWMQVEDGEVGIETVNAYADKVGVKEHGNKKIPCSRLMRAIVASRLSKGAPSARRRRQRATTFAGAVTSPSGTDGRTKNSERSSTRPARPGNVTASNTLPPKGVALAARSRQAEASPPRRRRLTASLVISLTSSPATTSCVSLSPRGPLRWSGHSLR
jgi:cell division septum initiation protein DivIVA